ELSKSLLPLEGNPVWLFQTVRTDFALIQSVLDDMLVRAEQTESMEPHSASYNVAMLDMHESANSLESNLKEALPYMFLSPASVLFAVVWVAAIILVFAAMRVANNRTRAKYEQQYSQL
ncbi:MAG TPA: hypothetical protein VJ742_01955, partial [Nitrososphaera sp.]|nr:hypothetical protein [Nitrososphaera sp.]